MLGANGNRGISLFLIFFFGLIGICFIYVMIRWLKNQHSPKIVTPATVTDKHIQIQYVHHRRHAVPGVNIHKMNIYYGVFQLEDGSKIELHISKLKYYDLQKGDKGTLFFQGKHYIEFQSENI